MLHIHVYSMFFAGFPSQQYFMFFYVSAESPMPSPVPGKPHHKANGGVEALAGVSNKVLFEAIAKQLGRPMQDHEKALGSPDRAVAPVSV